MVYWYNSAVKPGRIELTTTPGDATVLIDNVKVGDHSPVSIEKSPGPYTLSVTRDGYARNDQNIELQGGAAAGAGRGAGAVAGHRLRADQRPAGRAGLARRRAGEGGARGSRRARTSARRASAPGHHVLEIRGENRFKPWRQDVEIEPGRDPQDPRDADSRHGRRRRRRRKPAPSRRVAGGCGTQGRRGTVGCAAGHRRSRRSSRRRAAQAAGRRRRRRRRAAAPPIAAARRRGRRRRPRARPSGAACARRR